MKAFPKGYVECEQDAYKGMDLRDYFAAKILGGVLSNSTIKLVTNAELAEMAYSLADAMMEARKL